MPCRLTAVASFTSATLFNSCMRMFDPKNQIILISSVTHSEAASQTVEKSSQYGVANLSTPTSLGVSGASFTHRFRGVAAS